MVNYSKGLIYKLCCNDPTVTDIYVGSTTNFSRRKAEHKYSCNSEDAKGYNTLVYKFIRENGSWVNWSMVLVREYETTSKQKLKRKERKYIYKLGATLIKLCRQEQKKKDMITTVTRYYKKIESFTNKTNNTKVSGKNYFMKKTKNEFYNDRLKELSVNVVI